MSYERPYRGGHHRRRYHGRDNYEPREQHQESPEEKLRKIILKYAEVDPIQELPSVVQLIRDHPRQMSSTMGEGFRLGVTEQPYKIPYYASLLRLLHDQPDKTDESPSLGKVILEDFWKGFQSYLDKTAWRETRLCVQFFAHLAVNKLVTLESMLSLLQSFLSPLDEFEALHHRAKRAALCVADGLMIAGHLLKPVFSEAVTAMIDSIQSYIDTIPKAKWIVAPIPKWYGEYIGTEKADELLDFVLKALRTLDAGDFAEAESLYPRPYSQSAEIDESDFSPFVLPTVLVPPEAIEMDSLSTDTGEEAQVKTVEWPDYFIRLFDDDVTANPSTPAGYVLRSNLLDLIDIFEVNRKECARLALEYPKWTVPGTFKPKPGTVTEETAASGKDWQLESTLIETILGALFTLPQASHKSMYYIALITELCKLSPSTVGPAVGKSIRKLYASLGDGLDVEVGRKFAEWFAVHMSNFGFQWVWKEWVPDLALNTQHPKRAFIRRALEFEIRLSYYDRILKTLPEPMQQDRGNTVPEEAPGPSYVYEEPDTPYHDAARDILTLMKQRSKYEDVVAHLESQRNTLEISDMDASIDTVIRTITVQSLLHLGSRSFSHLLNALERYLGVLRHLAKASGSAGNAEAKAEILTAAADFWKHNRQMVAIVFDKLMQYQIVDPTDVVGWTFANGSRLGEAGEKDGVSLSAFEWDLMKAALDKANGRVMIARRRVTMLRKEEDDNRARVKATDASSMEVDADMKVDSEVKENGTPAVESPALATAMKAFTSLTREQKMAFSRTLTGFVSCLAPSSTDPARNRHASDVITEAQWDARASWGEGEWKAWETWAWYRQFCRSYSPYLRNYSTTLGTIAFAKVEGSTEPAAELLKRTWMVATGQDS